MKVDKQLQTEQRRWFDNMAALGKSYREDPEFRAQMDEDPRAILAGKGLPLAPGARVRVVADTKDTINMVFPPATDVAISEEVMREIAGGSSASTAGTATTAACLGSASISTISTASSAGSVGSAGTVDG